MRRPLSPEADSLTRLDCAPGSRVIVVTIDSKSNTDALAAVGSLQQPHGIDRLDTVIANAGVFDPAAHQRVGDMKLADLEEHVNVNAYGVVRLFQATSPLLQCSQRPVFLLVSAGAATMGGAKTFAHFPLNSYAASKTLANFLVLRIHMEHPNVIAFAVHPGSVVTENRTAAVARLGVPAEGLSVNECASSLLTIVRTHHCTLFCPRLWKPCQAWIDRFGWLNSSTAPRSQLLLARF